MPRILPRPFDDLVDLRTDDQRQADALRTGEQREQLLSLQNDDNQAELVRILQERRAANTDAVVRFEMAERPLPPALVVPREILLRSDPNQDFAAADEILRAAGFEPRDLVDQPIESAELAARLRSFIGPADANLDLVLNTVGQLTDAGFEAAPTAVLVQHPVVKNNAGPAPSQPNLPDSDHLPEGRIVVAVIDTGIAAEIRTDGWLSEVRRRTADNVDPLDAFGSNPGPNGFLDFAAGHGTFVAGIVRHVDPEAEIRSYLALDSDGFGSELSVASAMIRAVREGADVVNLSLGMRTVDNQPCLALETALDIIDEMSESLEPPALVASAGNYGDDRPVWPAASRRVISVGALAEDPDDRSQFLTAQWSSRGVWVDCSTIGEGIVSTYVEGQEDPVFGGTDIFPLIAWAVWSGTSFAAPQVAGAISRTCRELNLRPRAAVRRLIRFGIPIPDFGRGLQILPGS